MDNSFSQIAERLNHRRFVVANNAHGLSSADTIFRYIVNEGVVSGTYQGGKIRMGQQVGRITGPDTLELLYHCVTVDGQLLAGWSRGNVGVDHTDRTMLTFVWGWLSGAVGGGESSYVELAE